MSGERPKSRLRDIADARFAIEDGAHDAERTTAAPAGNRFRRMWFALGSTVLAIALVAAWWTGRRSAAPPTGGDNPLADAKFTRFTDLPGSEWDASISPDGKFVVFQSDSAGRADVWLSQVGTGGFTNLTQGRLVTGDLFVRNMGISHDGSEVWFAGRFPDRRLKRMPLLGGTPSNFLQEHSVNLAWSPDGARLAYHTGEPGDPMFVADRNGGSPRKSSSTQDLAGIIISRSGPVRRKKPGLYAGRLSWQDFWLLDLATMKSRALTKLANNGAMRTFDITPDDKQIVFDRARDNSDIVLIDLSK